ncbi:hypothetical protein [Viridibacillus arvi]|uniref:hypothetical protein n=1 Tax=Viridibacillus arvi TaxID=263475 RepID=UPI00187B857E|nr:hypothetical protein [Viridibacillus sp. JNUCC-6]QOV12323.1 hypothetical protein JNUCC6_06075 [Viridibacillus sp. JNUCC-6]
MFEVLEVNHTNFYSFKKLLLPAHFEQLEKSGKDILGVGAISHTEPVGLLLVNLDTSSKFASIFHFVVNAENNEVDIIELLLDKVEELLEVGGFYTTDLTLTINQSVEEVQKILLQRAWSTMSAITHKYVAKTQRIQDKDWTSLFNRLDNLKIVHWSATQEDNINQIILNNDPWFPPKFSPLNGSNFIDSEYSFALYDNEDLAGWIICEKVANNMLLCKNIYVRKSATTRLGGMLLIAKLIRKIDDLNMFVTFLVEKNNRDMGNIVSRRFKNNIIRKDTLLKFVR